ncbi:hypothetical protein FRX31_016559 [Thalictrum thalictroides]|uniref:Uncharacterized protein n=1 Tax=Thalictrum thalictroides TaxID=46969 RepID=A0A7J6W8X6_THATH|nr:hypothetical protein FRX31_016559 [Thalictrum thalictroides]
MGSQEEVRSGPSQLSMSNCPCARVASNVFLFHICLYLSGGGVLQTNPHSVIAVLQLQRRWKTLGKCVKWKADDSAFLFWTEDRMGVPEAMNLPNMDDYIDLQTRDLI